MRTATIHLDGEDRILCFSTGVMEQVYEEYGDLNGFFAALTDQNGNPIKPLVWALDKMMQAGARYAKRKGIPAAPPLTADDIRDVCDLSDFANLQTTILSTITAGSAREVEAEPPKNGETTPTGTAAP